MKYTVSASSCWRNEQLVEEYGEKLAMFNATVNGIFLKGVTEICLDEDTEIKVEVEINSLEVLRDFIGTFGTVVMGSNHIEIYDDYRE